MPKRFSWLLENEPLSLDHINPSKGVYNVYNLAPSDSRSIDFEASSCKVLVQDAFQQLDREK